MHNLNNASETLFLPSDANIYLDTLICSSIFLTQNFLSSLEDDDSTAKMADPITAPPKREREPVQILIIGSGNGINTIVRTLHRLRFAEANEWSPLLPAPTPGKLMRTLTRYLPTN
jgi:hypothetical protein